jgi:hypothetical protein
MQREWADEGSDLLSVCKQSDDHTVYPKLARTDGYSSLKCDVTVKTAVFWDMTP